MQEDAEMQALSVLLLQALELTLALMVPLTVPASLSRLPLAL